MPKIALIRVHAKYHEEFDDEWVKDHMTEFAEVADEEFQALREFVHAHNRNNHIDQQRYILVEDESHLLPKTIAEAMEYAIKKKEEWRLKMEKMEKEKKEKEKAAAGRKKARETEKLRKTVAELEKYKAKLVKMEKAKPAKMEKAKEI